jgi:hypothetical protein
MADDIKKQAKRAEDEYFAKLDFERKRKKLEEEHHAMKAAQKRQVEELHWMRCPKCGMEMVEIDFEGVKIDKCTECMGIYFDDGELDQILKKKDPGLFDRFVKLFK